MEPSNSGEKLSYIAYLRESTALESGIELQRDKIEKYAKAYDINIIKYIEENNKSAFSKRSKFDKMMEQLYSDDNITGIICSSLTRFGRKSSELILTHEKMKKNNKKLILVDNNIDGSTITGKAMLNMMSVFAELERDTIKERTAAGRERALKLGSKSGLPLNRPRLQIDWKEYDRYYKLGLSTNAIAKILVDKRTGKHISKSAMYKAVSERKE